MSVVDLLVCWGQEAGMDQTWERRISITSAHFHRLEISHMPQPGASVTFSCLRRLERRGKAHEFILEALHLRLVFVFKWKFTCRSRA